MLTQIINEAKERLVANFFDIPHDIVHHYKVWQNCVYICSKEKLKVDDFSLQVASWWHDYDRAADKHEELKKVLVKYDVQKNIYEKILNIVGEHSYGQNQTTIESKVLYDADKLEYIDVYRWIYSYQAVKDNLLSVESFDSYKNDVNMRLANVIKNLHFPSSRKLFSRKISLFVVWAKKAGIYKQGKLA